MKKKWIRILCAAGAAAMLLSGCTAGKSPAGSGSTPASAALSASTNDGTLHMTQDNTVASKAYEKKDTYAQFLQKAQPFAAIPGLKQGMVPQGMGLCAQNERIYISGYFSADAELPSAIVALDASTGSFVSEYYLYNADGTPFCSHVGGVAVTEDTLYVSAKLDNDGSYSVAAIPLSDLAESGSQNVTIQTVVPVPVSPSFMSYANGVLWIGNFYYPAKDYGLSPEINFTTASADGTCGCYILGYAMGDKEAAFLASSAGSPMPDYVLVAPDRIQGMTMLENGTVILSQSYGRKSDSTLLCYKLALTDAADTQIAVGSGSVKAWILDSARQTQAIQAMPMTEALSDIPGSNTCYVLFESGAMHYDDGKYRTDCLWKLNLDA